ncbi:MAG: hypothetical protein M1832_004788 [Thelocarpon impressellum]|nr:MAG: hypothetical protein M1832_004788 [Thelocarpon impressellum]
MTGVTKIIDDALEANKNNPELSSLELWSFQFQPLPKLFSDISVSKGGNVLGLQDEPDTNVIFMFDLAWSDASQDAAFTATSKAVLRDINKYTKKQKAFVEFEYLPYSVIDANPLRSYGSNNLRKMRRVSREFDPNQVFQKLVPGGFKLDAAGHA